MMILKSISFLVYLSSAADQYYNILSLDSANGEGLMTAKQVSHIEDLAY